MRLGGLEKIIRDSANRLGLDIHRYRPATIQAGRLVSMLAAHRVDVLFDVGANIGQFAEALRKSGFKGRIVSFEPLPAEHAMLVRKSRADSQWDIAPRAAIGASDGEVELNVSGNSFSSSVLEMLEVHTQASPDSRYVSKQIVPLSRLDTVAARYLAPGSVPFVKIDTQGFEDRVLDGAGELLGRAQGVQVELSFVPLYDGQKLFHELVRRLTESGFSIWAIWPGVCAPDNGRMLQTDVIFFRDSIVPAQRQ